MLLNISLCFTNSFNTLSNPKSLKANNSINYSEAAECMGQWTNTNVALNQDSHLRSWKYMDDNIIYNMTE